MVLAPGKKPFESLDLQSTAQLPNGEGDHGISAVHEEHPGKFAHRQPAQVFFSSFVFIIYILKDIESTSVIGRF